MGPGSSRRSRAAGRSRLELGNEEDMPLIVSRRRLGLLWLLLAGGLLAPPVGAEDEAPPAPVTSWYTATIARGDTGSLLTH